MGDGIMFDATQATINRTICYSQNKVTSNGVSKGDYPWNSTLTTFILQTTLILTTSRVLTFFLKPFRQPRVIAEIIGGILLGPSVMGNYHNFADNFFPLSSLLMLERMANIGLLFFLFLVGVELDMKVLQHTGKKAFVIAISGIVFPILIVGSSAFFYDDGKETINMDKASFLLFVVMAVSVTAFSVLAQILTELRLLNSELGKLAMSVALLNDMFAWFLLAFAMAMGERDTSGWAPVGTICASIGFVGFCIFIIRPIFYWLIRRIPEGGYYSDVNICLILTGVVICGFVSDAIGTHSIFGAFVYGLVIPEGQLGATLVEKLEYFVTGMLLPLFFAISGQRTNIPSLYAAGYTGWVFLTVMLIVCAAAKVVVILMVALFYQIPFQESFTLGLLMNSKGLIEMIVLNVGREQKVLDDQAFASMVILAVVMTSFITPMVMTIYRPSRRFVPYKCRTIQRSKPDSELRILACIHTQRNVPILIKLLEATNHAKRSPLFVYGLHLVQLTSRVSEMLAVHTHPALQRTQAESNHIFNALVNYARHAIGISIHRLTIISPYPTMHEEICNIAEDKHTAFIILPFHKQLSVDGGMETTNSAIRTVNQNVLANAPCSVGILVDKGLGNSKRTTFNQISHNIAVLFFAGPDDREALSYASRMVEHHGITLTILRFVPGDNVMDPTFHTKDHKDPNDKRILTMDIDNDREKQIDDEFLRTFRLKNMDKPSIRYMEKVVNNGEETVAAIRSSCIYDLFIVGRGYGMISPLTAGLTDWSECLELGAIGDLLASRDFAAMGVLVVQQYVGMGLQGDMLGTPDSAGSETKLDYFELKSDNIA